MLGLGFAVRMRGPEAVRCINCRVTRSLLAGIEPEPALEASPGQGVGGLYGLINMRGIREGFAVQLPVRSCILSRRRLQLLVLIAHRP